MSQTVVIKGNIGKYWYDIHNNIYRISVATNSHEGTKWYKIESSYSPMDLNQNPKIPIRKGSFVVVKCLVDSFGDLYLTKSEESYLKVLK